MAPPPVIKRKLNKLSYCNKSYFADYSCLNLALLFGLESFEGECSSLMNYFALFCGPRFNCMRSKIIWGFIIGDFLIPNGAPQNNAN
jgi:hypothetical protein